MRRVWCAVGVAVCMMAAAGRAWAQDENLLQNPGLESGDFGDWTFFGQGWRVSNFVGENSRDMHDGAFGVLNEIAPTDGDEWRGLQQVVHVKPGRHYQFGAWVRVAQVGRSQSYLEIQFLDKQSNVIEQAQSAPLTYDQEFSWVCIEDAEAPQGCRSAAVRAVVQMLGTPERDIGYHMFDDFVLAEQKKSGKTAKSR